MPDDPKRNRQRKADKAATQRNRLSSLLRTREVNGEVLEGPLVAAGADPVIRARLKALDQIMSQRMLDTYREAQDTEVVWKKGIFGQREGMFRRKKNDEDRQAD